MRLIDADELVEILPFDFSEAEAIDIINKMPTAYNFWIARHKLEEEYNAAFADWDTSGLYEYYGEMEAYKNAIKIVDDVLRESQKNTTKKK